MQISAFKYFQSHLDFKSSPLVFSSILESALIYSRKCWKRIASIWAMFVEQLILGMGTFTNITNIKLQISQITNITNHKYHKSQISQITNITNHKYHKSQISRLSQISQITNVWLGNGHHQKYDKYHKSDKCTIGEWAPSQIWKIWQITYITNHIYHKSHISQITNITNAWLGNGHLHRLHWFIADSGKHSQPQTFCKTCHCYISPMHVFMSSN